MILAEFRGRDAGAWCGTSGDGNAASQPPTANTGGGRGRQVTPVLEPKAIDLLKAMSARLASARTMTFTAVSTYESPSHIGPPLAYTTISEVTLQRPDKLRVMTPGDGPASEFYYDGKTMMAYMPAENLVAVAEAPADDRRRPQGSLRFGCGLFSLHRCDRSQSLPGPRRWAEACLRHRPIPCGQRHDNRHGGDRQ